MIKKENLKEKYSLSSLFLLYFTYKLTMKQDLSIVIPIYNEEESIQELIARIRDSLESQKFKYEIIFIDDGSTDKTLDILKRYERDYNNIKVYSFRKNLGKSVALSLGFQKAKGEIIATMDADLQDDPQNLPDMIEKLKKDDLDLVGGWRKDRKDGLLKVVSSKFFNLFVIPLMFNTKLHDLNCGLKVYKKDLARELKIYGGMHRFIPILSQELGFKVGEIPVAHKSRKYGVSKYRPSKILTDIPDLMTMYFIIKYNRRPLHFFSKLGGILLTTGVVILIYLTVLRIEGQTIGRRPLLIFGVLFVIAGIQTIFTGLLADLMVNINRNNNDKDLPIKYQSS